MELDLDVRFSWLPVPESRRGTKVQATGGHFTNIPVGADQAEAAFKFLEFLTTDEALDIIFEGAGYLTTSKTHLAKMDFSDKPEIKWFVDSVQEADELRSIESVPVQAFWRKAWLDTVDAVKYGDMTPAEGAKSLQEKLVKEAQETFPEYFPS
jgi:ABC-type glycerol-3-phosphate transport system substrate-binding protein